MECESYQEDDAETRGSHTPDLPLGEIPLGPPPSEPTPLGHPTINTQRNMDTSLRRSNRIKRLSSCLWSYISFQSLLVPIEDIDLGIIYPIVFASISPDELYYHQSMKSTDDNQFAQACVEEVRAHHENGHCAVVLRSKIPSNTKIVHSKCGYETEKLYCYQRNLQMESKA